MANLEFKDYAEFMKIRTELLNKGNQQYNLVIDRYCGHPEVIVRSPIDAGIEKEPGKKCKECDTFAHLPTLTGTKKQISWATIIRDQFIRDYKELAANYTDQTAATWWIANRHNFQELFTSTIDVFGPIKSKGYLIRIDGGSRGNPGECGAGAVLYKDGIVLEQQYAYTKYGTNNEAEYQGLILGLKMAIKYNIHDLQVEADSAIVMNQMSKKWKIKADNLISKNKEASALAANIQNITYTWIPRYLNKAADTLCNTAMDLKASGINTNKENA